MPRARRGPRADRPVGDLPGHARCRPARRRQGPRPARRGDAGGPGDARRSGRPARLDFPAMPTFRAPRGLRDLLPAERSGLTRLEGIAADLASRYGYKPIETPLFEQAAVFERGLGEVTDVIEKGLFLLAPRDEAGERWALRPS